MASTAVSSGVVRRVRRWWGTHRAYRAQLAHAAWDLRERYGPAAYGIALNSARQPIGSQGRQFWDRVAARVRSEDFGTA
jgi:hypothetical protein